ncbi:MAG TPA: CorA family divalent cation transporter, partial [Bacteroidales bacterium]
MIRLYRKSQNIIIKTVVPVDWDAYSDLIWIDLQGPTLEEIVEVENRFGINIPSRLQQEEIESSSRYTETDDCIIANSTFLQANEEFLFENIHVSFVIKGDLLFTYREGLLRSFAECVKKIKTNPKPFVNGKMILLALFETRVDFDADLIESISRKISLISKQLTNEHVPEA